MNAIYSIFLDVKTNFSQMMPYVAASLRKFGKFDGDVYFFSNNSSFQKELAKYSVRFIHATPTFGNGWHITSHKFKSFFQLDYRNYEKILFIDGDTLSINPIAPFFALKKPLALISSGPLRKHINGGRWFKYDNKNDPGVYSGYILGESNVLKSLFEECLEIIEKEPEKFRKFGDQAVLNGILSFQQRPYDYELLKGTTIINDYLERLPKEVVLNPNMYFKHYSHFLKNIVGTMKKEIKLLEDIKDKI